MKEKDLKIYSVCKFCGDLVEVEVDLTNETITCKECLRVLND